MENARKNFKNYRAEAWMKALMAVLTNRRTMQALMIMPMTFRRLSHFLLFQPMVWNMLQKPCSRWRKRATNHTM